MVLRIESVHFNLNIFLRHDLFSRTSAIASRLLTVQSPVGANNRNQFSIIGISITRKKKKKKIEQHRLIVTTYLLVQLNDHSLAHGRVLLFLQLCQILNQY